MLSHNISNVFFDKKDFEKVKQIFNGKVNNTYELEEYLRFLSEIALVFMNRKIRSEICKSTLNKIFNKFIKLPFHEEMIKCNIKYMERMYLVYTFIYNRGGEFRLVSNENVDLFFRFVKENKNFLDRETNRNGKFIKEYFEMSLNNNPMDEKGQDNFISNLQFFLLKDESIMTLKTCIFLGFINDTKIVEKIAYFSFFNEDINSYIQLITFLSDMLEMQFVNFMRINFNELSIVSLLVLLNEGGK